MKALRIDAFQSFFVCWQSVRFVNIFCDSELIVRQVNGDYKVKNERMIKLHSKTLDLCSMLENWSVSHVMREKNTEADLLSKEGLVK